MRPWFGVALASTGCHAVFGLDHLEPPGPDAAETCAKLTSHDEDNDRVFDGCDNCPGIVNADQLDDDSDGVGDACDPHRGTIGDKITAFFGFDESTLTQDWDPLHGPWGIAGDALVAELSPPPDSVLKSKLPFNAPFEVEAHLVIDQTQRTVGESAPFAVVVNFNAGTGSAACAIGWTWDFNSSAHYPIVGAYVGSNASNKYPQTPIDEFRLANGTSFLVQLSFAATELTCRFTTGGVTYSIQNTYDQPIEPGTLALAATNMRAHVDYLVIYDDHDAERITP